MTWGEFKIFMESKMEEAGVAKPDTVIIDYIDMRNFDGEPFLTVNETQEGVEVNAWN